MKMVPFLMLKSPFRNRRNTVFLSFWWDKYSITNNGSFEWKLSGKEVNNCMVVKIVLILLCIPGSIMAIINAIRDDPPFTIMEKRKRLDKKVRERTVYGRTGYEKRRKSLQKV